MRHMGKKMCERKETEALLSLMRAALRQEFEAPLAWADGCDAEKLDAMIRRQSLVTMVYPVVARQQGGRMGRPPQEPERLLCTGDPPGHHPGI